MAILFALAAAIGWGSSDYAGGHASRKSSAVSVVILTHLASLIALIVIATMPGQTGAPGVDDLLWGLAAGLGGGFGAMLLFSGLGKGTMSVVAPITAVGAAIIPVVAGVLQGESLSNFGVLGILLAFVAIVLVSLSPEAPAGTEPATDGAVGRDGSDGPAGPGEPAGPETDRLGDQQRHRRDHEATIAAMEAQFEPMSVPDDSVLVAETMSVGLVGQTGPVASAGAWSAPVGGPVDVAPPVVYRSLNEFARAVHEQRDAFELARLGARPAPTMPVAGATGRTSQSRTPSPDVPGFVRAASMSTVVSSTVVSTVVSSAESAGRREAVDERLGGRIDLGDRLRTMLRRPGVVEALFSGLGFGLFFVFIARTSEDAGHWPLVGARFISVLMFAAGAIIAMSAVLPHRESRRTVVLAGLLDAAAAVFFVLATRSGLLSIGAVLASLYPAVTVLLARFVGKERITRLQLGGLLLAGASVTLLVL